MMLQDYIEQLGSVAEFMPARMKDEYQYICVENLLLLEESDTQTCRYILKNGIESRFSNGTTFNPSDSLVESYLDSLINHLESTQNILLKSSERLRKQFKTQPDTKSMDAFLRSLQAYRKIRAAFDLPASQSHAQFQQAEQLLNSSLAINDFDYIANFQLGWLYLCILNQIDKAQKYFEMAAEKSRETDPNFYIFAQRYLAFSHFLKQEYSSALQIIHALESNTQTAETRRYNAILDYEHTRYALYTENSHIVAEKMVTLSTQHPLYYLLIQTEQAFQDQHDLQHLVEKIRTQKIQAIQKAFDQRWQRCPLRLIQMEEGCNVNRVYYRTLKHYLPELEQVAFVDLGAESQRVGDTIFQVTRANITHEIDKRHQQYTEEITAKQQHYAWLHRTGRFLFSAALYIIVALLVLGVYLVLDRYFIPGDSGITVNNWMLVLSGMILVLIIGFIGTIFETRPVRTLFAKQQLVNDALDKLHQVPDTKKNKE